MTNDIRTLYICSTYHHVHVALIKTLTHKDIPTDIVISDDIPGYIELQCALIKSEIFRHVYFFNRTYSPGYNPTSYLKRLCGRHKKHRKIVEREFKVDLKRYDNIYIFHDGTKLARYLMDCKISFNLIEDGLDHFKHLNYVPSKLDIPKGTSVILKLKRFLNIGYLACGQSKYCKTLEVNSKENLIIQHKHIIEVPKKELYNLVNAEQKKTIYNIFLGDYKLPENIGLKSALLFTVPLYQDNFVKTKEMHLKIYTDIIRKLEHNGYYVYIKPHPRDDMDYTSFFPEVSVIRKEIPSEVLNYNEYLHFNIAIAVASASIYNVNYAERIINLDYGYLNQYPEYLTEWLKESFA